MNNKRPVAACMWLTLLVLLLTGCSGLSSGPTAVPPAASPTATLPPESPTATPTLEPIDCALQCTVVEVELGTEPRVEIYSFTGMVISGGSGEIMIEALRVDITCESGEASYVGERATQALADGIEISIDEQRSYADMQHTYDIAGKITYDASMLAIASYDLTVTGGVFGDTPQNCGQ